MPFACLFVPDFPVQAVVRLEPELRNKAVGIWAGVAPLTKVFAANPAARALGAEPGITKMQAEVFDGITWRWRSLAQEKVAHAALFDCAWSISPRVEDAAKESEEELHDAVVMDIAGCERLFGSPEKIARDLTRVASEVGLDVHVAIAGNPAAAIRAAQGFPGITVIPQGEEASWMGALTLQALRIPLELEETLHRWGIRTCAEFAALPEVAVVERLGQEGLRWQKLAQGADLQPLIAREFPDQFEECMEMDAPVELLEPLLFILNRLLEQICARLRMHILVAGEIKVTLEMQRPDSRGKDSHSEEPLQHVRTIRLPVPARDGKFLLRLLQLDLEAHPPGAPVTRVVVQAVPAMARSRQLGLFLPLSPDPRALEITLAKIQNTVGEGCVGSPVLLDTYRPNAFRQEKFSLPEAALAHSAPKHTSMNTAAMRIYRPPLRANVDIREGKPARVSCEGVQRQVLAFAGPWRTKGEWWSETAWARDEWDVQMRPLHPSMPPEKEITAEQETAVYRIYKDLHRKQWFVEGIYD